VIKNTLGQNPNVLNYSLAECAPFFGFGEEKEFSWEGNTQGEKVKLSTYGVDEEFINVFKMNMSEGRWFSKEYASDKDRACVINQTAASLLGWSDPVGKTLDNGRLKVIGVVEDFDQVSLMMKIPPMVLTMNSENVPSTVVAIKINENNRKETRRAVNEIFNSYFPETPVELRLLEDGFDQGYMTALENVMKIFILFSVISVALVIIGLYSLISFSLKKQEKMIAVRKILGASSNGLFKLILKEYVILYGIAACSSLFLLYFLFFDFLKSIPKMVVLG